MDSSKVKLRAKHVRMYQLLMINILLCSFPFQKGQNKWKLNKKKLKNMMIINNNRENLKIKFKINKQKNNNNYLMKSNFWKKKVL